ncbi:hypothetical protein E4T80_09990 [Muribacter muris]|uniref:Uncharacterized protein n=1 Tax=Muribacter muris TaxID=67855 RepID=A0A4Y9JSC5_9PAST|nr:hypothetical protein [Muribacter muris]MBF0785790.1 hypothetical protein [Muribacter muris]MBF0828238.1 hypothetical protein [Muribacter muris]TFV08611.1 hypothetical protein E4T80_09990 [Muribacter muris]
MSIADIFKIQQSYNLNDKFNDQTNWQDAFKIANSFAETSEKHRANRENLATSAYRVDAMNALNKKNIELAPYETKAGIAKAKYDIATLPAQAAYDISRYGDIVANEKQRRAAQIAGYFSDTATHNLQGTKAQSELDYINWQGKNMIDPLTGEIITPEQAKITALRQGIAQSNPALMYQFLDPAQKFAQDKANNIAAISPQHASEIRAAAGLSDTTLNNEGQVVDTLSGRVIGTVPKEVLGYYATGTQPPQPKDNSKFRQDLILEYNKEIAALETDTVMSPEEKLKAGQRILSRYQSLGMGHNNVMQPQSSSQPSTQTSLQSLSVRFPGMPVSSEANTQANIQVPYALGDMPTNTTQATPVPVDYIKQYNLTDGDLALVNQYAQAKGIAVDDALKDISQTLFQYRQNGTFSPEQTLNILTKRIEREKALARNRALLADPKVAQMQQRGLEILDDYGIGVRGYFR